MHEMNAVNNYPLYTSYTFSYNFPITFVVVYYPITFVVVYYPITFVLDHFSKIY